MFKAKPRFVCFICILSLLVKYLEFKEEFINQNLNIKKKKKNLESTIFVRKVYFVKSLVAEINV